MQINHSTEARVYRELGARGNQLGMLQSNFPGFMHGVAILPLTKVENKLVGDDSQVRLMKGLVDGRE